MTDAGSQMEQKSGVGIGKKLLEERSSSEAKPVFPLPFKGGRPVALLFNSPTLEAAPESPPKGGI